MWPARSIDDTCQTGRVAGVCDHRWLLSLCDICADHVRSHMLMLTHSGLTHTQQTTLSDKLSYFQGSVSCFMKAAMIVVRFPGSTRLSQQKLVSITKILRDPLWSINTSQYTDNCNDLTWERSHLSRLQPIWLSASAEQIKSVWIHAGTRLSV